MLLCRVKEWARGEGSRCSGRPYGRLRSASSLLTTIALLATGVTPVYPQVSNSTSINLATQGRNADFSTFTLTRPITVGTVLPTACVVGQLFFSTSAPAGSNVYGCTAVNTWTVQGAGATASVGAASFSLSSLSFPTQQDGTTSTAQTFTLTNSGSGPLNISSIWTSGTNGKDFAQTNNCGSSLTVGGTCTISVVFKPTVNGGESGAVSFSDNAKNSPQTVSLSGTGVLGPVLTPATLSAAVGTPLTVTANRSVTWALAPGSVGSLSSASATSVVYTPPASIAAANVQGGCPVAPADSIFNTRIDNLPVHPNSAQYVQYLNNPISFYPSMGTNILDNTVPVTNGTFLYTTAYNGTPYQIAPKPSRKRETGSLTTDGNNDHHMVSVNHQTCQFYETYQDGNGGNAWMAESG